MSWSKKSTLLFKAAACHGKWTLWNTEIPKRSLLGSPRSIIWLFKQLFYQFYKASLSKRITLRDVLFSLSWQLYAVPSLEEWDLNAKV